MKQMNAMKPFPVERGFLLPSQRSPSSPPLVIGALIWHIPERYGTYLIFDKQNNLLKVVKKGRERDVKLNDVKKIILKTIGPIGKFNIF